jgi:enoyl-CoA hydratase
VTTESESDGAVLTAVDGPVLVITLNRPDVRNAIDSALSLGVFAAFERLDADDDLRVGVITGAGDTFCAGLDLRAFARSGLPRRIGRVYRQGSRKPLVAAIEGAALGGGLEMALVADLLVAARDATFASPEVRHGLFPGGGALIELPRSVPMSVVNRMALTGEAITADDALRHGLLTEVTEPGDALAAATALAHTIAGNGPLGVQAVKELLRGSTGLTEDELWTRQNHMVDIVFTSEDAKEGALAFAEKRAPVWRGR